MMKSASRILDFELLAWFMAIAYLAYINPDKQHFIFCIYHLLGISFCPGCGIGHSISYLLHGNFTASMQAHFLGVFALPMLIYRIYSLLPGQLNTISIIYKAKTK